MQGDNFTNQNEFSEAIAEYLEQINGGATVDRVQFAQRYPDIAADLQTTLALLALPKRPVATDTKTAWASFKQQVFTEATASTSLGEYVAQAQQSGDKNLASTGLSRASLDALKAEQTTLGTLKEYQLPDYAALAKRHGVSDAAFPRFLKWLKGVSKSLGQLASPAPRGMMYARDKDTRQPGLSEAEIKDALSQPETDTETPNKDE